MRCRRKRRARSHDAPALPSGTRRSRRSWTLASATSRESTEYSFRADVAAPVLKQVIEANAKSPYVMELPPSGVKDSYWRILKRENDATIVALCDRSANIIKRIAFYDDDSKPIEVKLSKKQEKLYLKEIQNDVVYFGRTYSRAHLRVDLDGAGIGASAKLIEAALAASGRVIKIEE